jgi:hypothetical protein
MDCANSQITIKTTTIIRIIASGDINAPPLNDLLDFCRIFHCINNDTRLLNNFQLFVVIVCQFKDLALLFLVLIIIRRTK